AAKARRAAGAAKVNCPDQTAARQCAQFQFSAPHDRHSNTGFRKRDAQGLSNEQFAAPEPAHIKAETAESNQAAESREPE
ncbi:MAG: hypothetical protein ACLP9L_19715, partial [Thermoguttaceae bacterium]